MRAGSGLCEAKTTSWNSLIVFTTPATPWQLIYARAQPPTAWQPEGDSGWGMVCHMCSGRDALVIWRVITCVEFVIIKQARGLLFSQIRTLGSPDQTRPGQRVHWAQVNKIHAQLLPSPPAHPGAVCSARTDIKQALTTRMAGSV